MCTNVILVRILVGKSCARSGNVSGMKKALKHKCFKAFDGGDKRDRTADLLNAIQALSQAIIYTPPFVSNGKETGSCNKLNGVEKLLDADIQRNSDFIIPVHVHAVDDPGNDHFLCRNIGVIVQVCPLEHIIKLL